MDFEERLQRLESISASLKKGDTRLEDAVAAFEEGMRLARSLEKDLAKIERRVEIVVNEPRAEGEKPVLELFPELNESDQG